MLTRDSRVEHDLTREERHIPIIAIHWIKRGRTSM